MNPPISGTRRRFALLGLVGIVAVFSFVPEALANPSQIQYGYDPIVDAGGSKPDQSGSEGAAPAENVDRASAVVAGIAGGSQSEVRRGTPDARQSGGDESRTSGSTRQRLPALDVASSPRGSDGSSASGSVWLFAILLGLSVGLIAWAVLRRRHLRGTGAVDLAIRSVSVLAFLVLVVLLNGSVASIIG